MASPSGTPRPDSFTQRCRDLVRTCTYEDIVGCIIYAPPIVFMIGPASIVADEPIIAIVVQSLVGFALSYVLHHMGHRFLTAVANQPRRVYFSRSRCFPGTLTLTQFLWMMELIVGAAVFSAIVGKRFIQAGDMVGLLGGLSLFGFALVLYFVPVHLGRLWIGRHYPAMTLVGPTEEVIKTSLPGIRWMSR